MFEGWREGKGTAVWDVSPMTLYPVPFLDLNEWVELSHHQTFTLPCYFASLLPR